jgi:hypothetical protein
MKRDQGSIRRLYRQILEKLGGRTRARTWDPMIKSHLLYQLSYAPGTGPEKPSQEGVV